MVKHAVIEGPEPDADILTIHIARNSLEPEGPRVPDYSKTDPVSPEVEPSGHESPQKRMARAGTREGRYSGPSGASPGPDRLANRVCHIAVTQPVLKRGGLYAATPLAVKARPLQEWGLVMRRDATKSRRPGGRFSARSERGAYGTAATA